MNQYEICTVWYWYTVVLSTTHPEISFNLFSNSVVHFTYSRRKLTRTMPLNWWKEALNLGSDWLLFRDHSPPERQDAGGSLWASRSAGLVLPRVRLCQTQQRNNRFRHRVFFYILSFRFPITGPGVDLGQIFCYHYRTLWIKRVRLRQTLYTVFHYGNCWLKEFLASLVSPDP